MHMTVDLLIRCEVWPILQIGCTEAAELKLLGATSDDRRISHIRYQTGYISHPN